MKCNHCGFENNKKSKYCQKCGKRVEKKENKFFKYILKNKIKIMATLCIILVLAIAYEVTDFLTGPDFIGTCYYNAVVNKKTGKILKYIDSSDNTLVSKELIKSKMPKREDLDKYKLVARYKDDEEALYEYRYNGDSVYVSLVKNGKKWLIFDNWTVNSGLLATNVKIKVPTGTKVNLDEIELTKYLDDKYNNGYDIYNLNNIIAGRYLLNLTYVDGTHHSEFIDISDKTTYTVEQVLLEEETLNKIEEEGQELVKSLYNNLINNVDINDVEYKNEVLKYYKDMNYSYKKANYNLNYINFKYIDLEGIEYSNGSYIAKYNVEYNYEVSYTKDGENKQYSNLNRGTVYLNYDYNIDKFELKSIKKLNIKF